MDNTTLQNIRRAIHRNPELSFREFETSAFIKQKLGEWGIEYREIGGTGVVAHIGNGDNCVALRADIDALPIHEETGLEYASQNPGVMHACGHDMHTTMLLGAAFRLKQTENDIKGVVKLIFQPGEEKLPGGAKLLIEKGVLENPRPHAIFGQHINPGETVGKISLAPGYVMASADELYITVKGKGSHAAQPHIGNDAILAASHLVQYYQTMVSKMKNPLDSGVISITAVNGGSANNIFPSEVKMLGTMRAFNQDWRNHIHEIIEEKTKAICSLYGCEADFNLMKGYPSLFNNAETTELARKTAIAALGKDMVLDFEPKMWAEDFSYYANEIPATFWFLGVRPENLDEMPPLHNSKLAPDESALATGVEMFVNIAKNYLESRGS